MHSSLRVMEAVLLSAKQEGTWAVRGDEIDAVTAILHTLRIQAPIASWPRSAASGSWCRSLRR